MKKQDIKATLLRKENGNYVIKISDFYDTPCNDQEYVEVSEETVDYLIEMKRIDKKVETREYRALVSFGYDDVHTAECCGVSSPATDEVFFEKMENKELYLALEKLNPSMSRRFYLYSVYGFTLERIGEMEGVSHTAVFKSIRRTAKLLRKYLSENN